MSIRDWPAAERPRERLLEQGAASLSDAELLAIFLRTGVAGKSAVDLARHLLSQFGSLRSLLEADQDNVQQAVGARAGEIRSVAGGAGNGPAASGRALRARNRRWKTRRPFVITSSRCCGMSLMRCLAACFWTPSIGCWPFEALFRGSIDSTSVHPRQVVKRALAHNAAALILCHNHPSGNTDPSQADRILTKRLQEALDLIDVRVLDHFIIGDGDPLSMAEYGWM